MPNHSYVIFTKRTCYNTQVSKHLFMLLIYVSYEKPYLKLFNTDKYPHVPISL